mmetsp:Transcript_93924/g.201598  ORF Transcript_93924/g.201598 Transcript_93924/m.201598 type:complete len:200 (-) Transcript_93924:79-678(-)
MRQRRRPRPQWQRRRRMRNGSRRVPQRVVRAKVPRAKALTAKVLMARVQMARSLIVAKLAARVSIVARLVARERVQTRARLSQAQLHRRAPRARLHLPLRGQALPPWQPKYLQGRLAKEPARPHHSRFLIFLWTACQPCLRRRPRLQPRRLVGAKVLHRARPRLRRASPLPRRCHRRRHGPCPSQGTYLCLIVGMTTIE